MTLPYELQSATIHASFDGGFNLSATAYLERRSTLVGHITDKLGRSWPVAAAG